MQLEALQHAMMEAIGKGPAFIEECAFAGGRKAAMRGLAVHANTISHARLVALEESFPRTREAVGEDKFNALSRDYLDLEPAAAQPLATIGRHFASFLELSGACDAAALAAFEWAWLESYHADESEALALSDLAGLGEGELMALVVGRHPAARLVAPSCDAGLAAEVPGIADAVALLLTRPEAEVLVSPANADMIRQFEILREPQPICNLFASDAEQTGEGSLPALLALLAAGSLVLANSGEG